MWPLFKIDSRTISMPQYTGKFSEKNNFNKKDFCIIYLELPNFVKKVAHILKSPQNYKNFLAIKYPHQEINSIYEIYSVYSDSMKDLE